MNPTPKRPMTVVTAVGLSLCIILELLPLMGCGRLGVYTASYFDTFDTVLTVTVGAPDSVAASKWSAELHEIARTLHAELTPYESGAGDSGIRFLNQNAGSGVPVSVSEDVMNVLLLGMELHKKTDGRLNICLGALTSLLHEARKEGVLPEETAVDEAMKAGSITSLELNEAERTAQLTDGSVSLDVGAIAKGYALEKMRCYAEEQGITSLLINFGGQVMAIGRHPDGDPWTVSIRDPRDGSVLETLEAENAVIATSAEDQRAFVADGVTYHHIIDPETGYPADLCRSVTVILPLEHTAISDGLSTALFLLPWEEGQALLSEFDACAVRMESDGTVLRENCGNHP